MLRCLLGPGHCCWAALWCLFGYPWSPLREHHLERCWEQVEGRLREPGLLM